MKQKITLKEIAKKCGVSVATASFVLNNKQHQGISDRTWQKIEKIAKKYGYNKNIKANNRLGIDADTDAIDNICLDKLFCFSPE